MSDYREILSIVFSILTCAIMIVAILLFPEIKIKGISLTLDTYWIVVLIGMIIVVACSGLKVKNLCKKLIEDTEINPLKILGLFISLSILSVYLDEIGFFQYLATIILKKAKSNQKKLFIYLYIIISILTIFASNDVIILAFTPFICYLSKNAGISPFPYLVMEFVTANSWSMTLVIGNPTNIFLGESYGIDFIRYLEIMIVPTVFAGIVSFADLFLIFKKDLSKPIKEETKLKNQNQISNKSNDSNRNDNQYNNQKIFTEEENPDKLVNSVEIYKHQLYTEPCEEHNQIKNLSKDINNNNAVEENKNQQNHQQSQIKDKPLFIEGLIHLLICVILLAISSYINLEMWIISLSCVGSLMIFVLITSAIERRKPLELWETLKRAPWELIPFVLGMYIIIVVIHDLGITKHIGNFLGNKLCTIKYGILSIVCCNFINNIPMSFLFSAIMENLTRRPLKQAVYSTIIASNIGAFFTPIGSLAGIMFTSILNKFHIKFGFLEFLKMGTFIALPTIIICLAVLHLMLFVIE